MIALTTIPVTLEPEALLQTAHVEQGGADEQAFHELLRLAQTAGRPKAVYRQAFIEARSEETITIQNITLHSRALAKNLQPVERFFAFVATCGVELDQAFRSDGDFLRDFWWDTIKTSVLKNALAFLQSELTERFSLGKTASMSPGSGDVQVWPIQQQKELFELLGPVTEQIGVVLTDSCLMIPNKSVSGILFPTEVDFHTCRLCHRVNCPSRRAELDVEQSSVLFSEHQDGSIAN